MLWPLPLQRPLLMLTPNGKLHLHRSSSILSLLQRPAHQVRRALDFASETLTSVHGHGHGCDYVSSNSCVEI